jgi:hypothetical protein
MELDSLRPVTLGTQRKTTPEDARKLQQKYWNQNNFSKNSWLRILLVRKKPGKDEVKPNESNGNCIKPECRNLGHKLLDFSNNRPGCGAFGVCKLITFRVCDNFGSRNA